MSSTTSGRPSASRSATAIDAPAFSAREPVGHRGERRLHAHSVSGEGARIPPQDEPGRQRPSGRIRPSGRTGRSGLRVPRAAARTAHGAPRLREPAAPRPGPPRGAPEAAAAGGNPSPQAASRRSSAARSGPGGGQRLVAEALDLPRDVRPGGHPHPAADGHPRLVLRRGRDNGLDDGAPPRDGPQRRVARARAPVRHGRRRGVQVVAPAAACGLQLVGQARQLGVASAAEPGEEGVRLVELGDAAAPSRTPTPAPATPARRPGRPRAPSRRARRGRASSPSTGPPCCPRTPRPRPCPTSGDAPTPATKRPRWPLQIRLRS